MSLTKTEVEKMSGPELVETYNKLSGKTVKRFPDRATGLKRVLSVLDLKVEKTEKTAKVSSPRKARTLAVDLVPDPNKPYSQYRPNTVRGKFIEKLQSEDGASLRSLMACEEGRDAAWVEATLCALVRTHGVRVVQLSSGNYKLDQSIDARKRFDLEPSKEQRQPRESSKRAKILGLLKGGATYDELVTEMSWKDKPARVREAIHLLNRVNGYGFKQDKNGIIKAFT